MGLRRRVSIKRFSNETTYGKSVLLGGDVLANQGADILSARLAESGKFLLFDPEVKRASAGPEFEIVGSVSEFGRTETGNTGFFGKTKTDLVPVSRTRG